MSVRRWTDCSPRPAISSATASEPPGRRPHPRKFQILFKGGAWRRAIVHVWRKAYPGSGLFDHTVCNLAHIGLSVDCTTPADRPPKAQGQAASSRGSRESGASTVLRRNHTYYWG